MSAPRILDVLHAPSELVSGLNVSALLDDPQVSAFVVMRSGTFSGRWFERGEVVVCRQGSRTGHAVVLVAHTRGRPLLGHQRGAGFSGDRGEPCSRQRWFAAGSIIAVWGRDRELGWRSEPIDGALDLPPWGEALRPVASRAADALGWGTEPSVAPTASVFQLSLFGASCARAA